ncbi:hypothetical protein PtA15_5A441 [Puccinia triticina]|uniref:Uncharacterized protein n=1 Tax=Puccinia triticina TaxID=208348 RepID=A0ABY7CKI7_9BASI|nr:uncharacterized protein PtA15_5A441 [Puccinia triticina]WAQ84868.1 hypothetical protein PtA15_5A441 [Puccinia triticina]
MRPVSSQVPSHFPPQPTPIAITRTTQVRTGGTPNITPSRIINDTPNITPSRIITDTGGQSGESGGPMPPPTIVPTPTRAPVITPSRIIDSTGPHTGHGRTPSVTTRRLANNPPPPNPIIHHGPPIPQPDLMSEDESLVDKVRASTSDDKAYSQYGSMDGFIRPPPPRGSPRITVPSDAQELPPPLAQTPSAVIRPTPQPVHQPPQPSTAVHQPPQTPASRADHRPAPAVPAPPCCAPPVGNHPLVDSMLASAQLSDTDLQLAQQLFNAPKETRWQLQVVMWLTQRRLTAALTAAADPAHETAHVYSQVFRTRVRQRIREILMQSTLESYSREHLCALATALNQKQSPAFRRQHLPAGILHNHKAMAGLVIFLRGMVKHEQTHMRNLLLSNV